MASTVITLKEAVALIDSGAIFSCEVCSFDQKRRDKSGKRLAYTQVKVAARHGERAPSRPQTEREKLLSKAQNHQAYHTRNVVMCQDGMPTSIVHKIHLPLLETVNGRQIVL